MFALNLMYIVFFLIACASNVQSFMQNRYGIVTPNEQPGIPPSNPNNGNIFIPPIFPPTIIMTTSTTSRPIPTMPAPTSGNIIPTINIITDSPFPGEIKLPSTINIIVVTANGTNMAPIPSILNVTVPLNTVSVAEVTGTTGSVTEATQVTEEGTSTVTEEDTSTVTEEGTSTVTEEGTSTVTETLTVAVTETSTVATTTETTSVTAVTGATTNIEPSTVSDTITITEEATTIVAEIPTVAVTEATETNIGSPGDITTSPSQNQDNNSTIPISEDTTQNPNVIITQPNNGQSPSSPVKMTDNIFEEKCDEYSSVGKTAVKVQVFIIGGTSSGLKEFLHMAALGFGNTERKQWLCGGSLISDRYVVTAAHCLSSKTLGDVQVVRLGTTVLQTETLDSEDYSIIKRTAHPDYIPEGQYNDIALLQLDRPVKFSEYIAPICLYSYTNITQSTLIATGWGKTEATGDASPDLQKVDLEYFPISFCQESYSSVSKQELPLGILEESQICAGSMTEEKDTCQGDSGGPLQIRLNSRTYLVGITSFGIGCGTPGSPGVYTRVSHYIPWIENIVWGSGK